MVKWKTNLGSIMLPALPRFFLLRKLEVCARQEQAWVQREPMREALGSDRSFRILGGSDPSMVLVVSGPG